MKRTAYGIVLLVLIASGDCTGRSARQNLPCRRVSGRPNRPSRAGSETEAVNRQNQGAILRLMNELGDLADGDLTVTATVSEDITGRHRGLDQLHDSKNCACSSAASTMRRDE
jgi:hypothetical protein